MHQKTILVTGGYGFIGRHLIKKLLLNNYSVISIDNGFRWDGSELLSSIQELGEVPFENIRGDILDEKIMTELIKRSDLIIHLAGISQVITSIQDSDKTFDFNIMSLKNIVHNCVQYKKKIIFSSSREVYGTAKYLPVDINHPLVQENPYGASKIMGEDWIRASSACYGLNYTILRLSNVYGPDDRGRVIPIFLEKAKNNETITLFGNNKIIDFVHVDDVIEAILLCIEQPESSNQVFNIGSSIQTTLLELAQMIKNITKSNSEIKIEPERKGEVDRYCADISEIKKRLSWKPNISLEKALVKIIEDTSSKI